MDKIVIVIMMSHMSKTINTTTITTAVQTGQINCATSHDTGHLHHSSATLCILRTGGGITFIALQLLDMSANLEACNSY